jgi:hypothetical protein
MQPPATVLQGEPTASGQPEPRAERHARRASAVSIPFLALIIASFIASFFLPSFSGDGEGSIFSEVVDSPWLLVLLGHPFLAAAVLLSLTAAALLIHVYPRRWSVVVTLGGLVWGLGSLAFVLAVLVFQLIRFDASFRGLFEGWSAIAAIAGIMLAVRGIRQDGWYRWGHLIGAYTLLESPYILVFFFGFIKTMGRCGVLPGGCMYVGSVLGLALTSLWAIVLPMLLRERRSPLHASP